MARPRQPPSIAVRVENIYIKSSLSINVHNLFCLTVPRDKAQKVKQLFPFNSMV